MTRPNLFAAQERGATLTKLGDTLQGLEQHGDFAAMEAAFYNVRRLCYLKEPSFEAF
ncbi:hypothetical protein ACLB1G_15740 [Oxalobacteraceae bacterium A2-2]